MTPEERVAQAARDWDGEGLLTEAALRRLAWRRARSGKRCERCQEWRPLSEFGRDVHEPDGMNRKCRNCRRSRPSSPSSLSGSWPSTPTSEEGPMRAAP